jgi:hypothetical protein
MSLITKLKEFSNETALDFEMLLIDSKKILKVVDYSIQPQAVGFTGYIFTDEVREKMRQTSINNKSYLNFPSTKGENHPMFGKTQKIIY